MLRWFAEHGRDLPWRRPGTSPWAVLVCEVMSHQTPVARVVPAWQAWLERWPTPSDLAHDSPGEAVRMWGRLGYPRRALRLHESAVRICERHDGEVPSDPGDLVRLPGVGPYTAAATAAFAFGRRTVVLDVNVRRVLARWHDGMDAAAGTPTRAEVSRADALVPPEMSRPVPTDEQAPADEPVPEDGGRSVLWNAAVMELGAVVCTARLPRCHLCPIRAGCSWADVVAGRTDDGASSRAVMRTTRPQAWLGTDRQVRGLILAQLRDSTAAVPSTRLDVVWHDRVQLERCLTSLVTDGLAESTPAGYRLPA